jgi:hypothetical protein
MPSSKRITVFACLLLFTIATTVNANDSVTAVDSLDTAKPNEHYVSNRAPLAPTPLIKLPVGSIRPEGWLRQQLEMQAEGFHGHLAEVSDFVRKEDNSWLSPTGQGSRGWEEVPYWLKGYLNCALVLQDEEMIAEAKIWIDGALNSQKEDGWFGPDEGRGGAATRLRGRDDLWPNMIMLFCLQDYHSATGDERVIPFMLDYFRYLADVPEDQYLLGYWPKMRGGDNLYSIYWLYNRTGEDWLLELAAKNHRQTARWDEEIINWHNVNFGQAFGEGTTWWMQSDEAADLNSSYRNWSQMREMYGQMPGGMFASDENCRPGYTDPHQCVETCGMAEAMLSDETLISITGDLLWADCCEDIAYNSMPAALTSDMKALRYLTAANQVVSDQRSHSPGIQNGGPMFLMTPHRHRCCQHNFGHAWPYFAEHLWYAEPGNGLAAVFYNDCVVKAQVGAEGQTVVIDQDTRYPFNSNVKLTIQTDEPVAFPIYLRVPGWCDAVSLAINNSAVEADAEAGQFLVINRTWNDGDSIELTLPMELTLRTWTENKGSVSIDRGPLTYSLKIGEEYVRQGGTDEWPAWEILPTTPWNYGLSLDENDPLANIEITLREWPENNMPWTHEGAPIVLTTKGRQIPEWTLDKFGLCSALQPSPARTSEPLKTVQLIPMGAARLRVSAFPTVTDSENAQAWKTPQLPQKLYVATASHCFGYDKIEGVADGILPENSNDHNVDRLTYWPNKGTSEWIEGSFDAPRAVSSIGAYWFDDTGVGYCRTPASWTAFYKDGDEWKPVALKDGHVYGTLKDQLNEIEFLEITTDAVRVEIELQPEFSGGVLELQIK